MIVKSGRRVGGLAALALAATAASGLFVSGAAHASSACTLDITGMYAGSVNVSHGVVCIHDAHVTGSVLVTTGVDVEVVDSQVDGAVSAAKADIVLICNSSMKSVSVSKASGDVVMGGTWRNGPCSGNHVAGNIAVQANRGSLQVVGNTYTGVLSAVQNIGSPIDISGNVRL